MKDKELLKRIVVGTVMCMTLLCVACGNTKEQEKTETKSNVIYEDDDVTIKEVDILENPQFVMSEWLKTDVKKEVENADAIIKCKVDDIKEISISTTYLDADVTAYRTVLNVKVENVLYDCNSSLNKGDIVKVSVCTSSYEYAEDILPFVKNNDYYLLLNRSDLIENDALKISSFSDYYINSPVQDVIAVMSDGCIVSELGDEDVKVEKLIEFYDIKVDSISNDSKIISDSDEVSEFVSSIKADDASTILNMIGTKKFVNETTFLEFVNLHTK